MKKITLLLSLAFLVFSCSDDDDSGSSVSSADLIGTWTLVSLSEDGVAIELDECEDNDTITFSETRVVETSYYFNGRECVLDYIDNDEYTLSGNTLTVIYEYDENGDGEISEDEKEEITANVSISGSTLTISSSGTDEDGETYSGASVYTKS